MMTKIHLDDLFHKMGIGLNDVLLIRHALSNNQVNKYYQEGHLRAYTEIQPSDLEFEKSKYWFVFKSEDENSAVFCDFYICNGKKDNNPENMPLNYPCPERFDGKECYYLLSEDNSLEDYKDKLIIDWPNPRAWYLNNKDTVNRNIIGLKYNY